jgi:polyisoprenoid-binding protein YceI
MSNHSVTSNKTWRWALGRHAASAILLALTGAVTMPALAQIDLAKSSVTATAKQLGVPIEGTFKKIGAAITFVPSQLAKSSAKIDIDVGSYDMGSPEYNKEVTGKEWFDAAKFPKASFVSSSISAAGTDKYTVAGKLSLKGRVVDVSLPVTVKTGKGIQTFDGTLPIKRTAFNIGDGEWKDTSVVADDVVIRFHIVVAEK